MFLKIKNNKEINNNEQFKQKQKQKRKEKRNQVTFNGLFERNEVLLVEFLIESIPDSKNRTPKERRKKQKREKKIRKK